MEDEQRNVVIVVHLYEPSVQVCGVRSLAPANKIFPHLNHQSPPDHPDMHTDERNPGRNRSYTADSQIRAHAGTVTLLVEYYYLLLT